METFLWNSGPALPLLMATMNVVSFTSGLMRGVIKVNALLFTMRYLHTVKPAAKGDLTPFLTVLSLPPS